MNRLFFRFFVLVMMAITGATFVIYFVFARLFGDPLDDIARRQASAQVFLLEQYVDRAPADEWLVRLNKVREVSEAHFDLIPLDQARAALPARQHAALERGQVVLDPHPCDLGRLAFLPSREGQKQRDLLGRSGIAELGDGHHR